MHAKNIAGMSRSAFSGSLQSYLWPGEWWEADVTLPQMTRADAEYWIAFLVSLRGVSGTLLLWDPAGKSPQGNPLGSPQVSGANQLGIQLVTTGWTASTTGLLLPGDYIQLGPSTAVPNPRLYKVLTQTNSDNNGNATLDIFPRLRESPANGDSIATSNCVGTFRLAKNDAEWDIDAARIYGISFQTLEAI
jgi:hypothetical protein